MRDREYLDALTSRMLAIAGELVDELKNRTDYPHVSLDRIRNAANRAHRLLIIAEAAEDTSRQPPPLRSLRQFKTEGVV